MDKASSQGNESGSANIPPVDIQSAFEYPRNGNPAWAPWLLAVALAIATVILAVQNRALNDELRGESNLVSHLAVKASHAQQVLEVLTSPNAKQVTLVPGRALDLPMGRVTYLADQGALVFQANGLLPLPEGHIYELWLTPANGEAPIPAGLFRPDAMGTANVVMPALPAGVAAKTFGVTLEKQGGAKTPTLPNLISGTVPGE